MAKLTKAEILKEAGFLVGWAKTKEIRRLQAGSTFHKSGKWMTKITPEMSEALREAGFAVGTELSFKMVKKAVVAAEGAI